MKTNALKFQSFRKSAQQSFFVLALSVTFHSRLQAETSAIRAYGEVTTLEREVGSSSMLLAKYVQTLGASDAKVKPKTYLGAEASRYSVSQFPVEKYSSLIGLELPFFTDFATIRGFAEYRFVDEKPRTDLGVHDPRFGVSGGDWRVLFRSSPANIFADSYFEWVATPRVTWDPTAVLKVKAGARFGIFKNIALDPFMEIFGRASSDIGLGRRALEVREGARLSLISQKWSGQIALHRVLYTFVEAPEARWVGFLNFGGEF